MPAQAVVQAAANAACVFSGSRSALSVGPDAANLTGEAHGLLVGFVRGVLDAVRPTRSALCLEGTAKVLPDGPEAYLGLLRDDRTGQLLNV